MLKQKENNQKILDEGRDDASLRVRRTSCILTRRKRLGVAGLKLFVGEQKRRGRTPWELGVALA
jgi:hypothetical protein